MIRKQPLRTYQKKKTAQSAICYSQPKFVESRTFGKRLSSNGKKNKLQDDDNIGDHTLSFMETTFDKVAKTARLPPLPPQQESHCSINTSSDVPYNEKSLVKTESFECLTTKESGKPNAIQRAKRKPKFYVQGKVSRNKRFKQDSSINVGEKKDRATVGARRKAASKTDGNLLRDSKENPEIRINGLTFDNSIGRFVENEENRREQNIYRSRRKANVPSILYSSSSDSDSQNCDNDVNKVKPKSKQKKKKKKKKEKSITRRNPGRRKLNILDSFDDPLGEVEAKDKDGEGKVCAIERLKPETKYEKGVSVDSCYSVKPAKISIVSNRTRSKVAVVNPPALEYIENSGIHSASTPKENYDQVSMGLPKFNKILTKKQYTQKIQSKSKRKNNAQMPIDPLGDLHNIDTCQNDVEHETKDLNNVKPCSVFLLNCNEKESHLSNGQESASVIQNCNNRSSRDIFQSGYSDIALNIEKESNDLMKTRFDEFAAFQRAQTIEHLLDPASNLDLDIKPDEMKIAKGYKRASLPCNPDRSLHYLMCSTPINEHVKIDKTINCLSPIIVTDQTFQEGRKFGKEKQAQLSVVNSSVNGKERNKECLNLPKTNKRRKSIRKRLSISYEEDKTVEMSDNYGRDNVIEEIPFRNVVKREYPAHDDNSEQIQSQTSQIQESLEILKNNTEDIGSSRKRISPRDNNGSNQISEFTKKCDDSNVFTDQSKGGCSQLTPTGIITTRSGRQLKLSMNKQKNFSNELNDSKIHHFDTDSEIIYNSETSRNKSLENPITKRRGCRFTALKSYPKRNGSNRTKISNATDMLRGNKNDFAKVRAAVNKSKKQTSKNSTSHESRNLNALRKSRTIPLHIRSDCSVPEFEKVSRIHQSISLDNEKNNTNSSDVSDHEREYVTFSDQDILQSLVESTKNLDALNIRSQSDVKTTTSCFDNKSDNSEWNTLSSNENSHSITSNPKDSIAGKSNETNRSEKLLSNRSRGLSKSNRKELMNDLSSQASISILKSPSDQSPQYTDLALLDRMKLLSSRVNTRKRRKTVLKPLTETFEKETGILSSNHSKLTNSLDVSSRNGLESNEEEDIKSITDPLLIEPNISKPYRAPVHVSVYKNYQPVVLLEKLEDPLKITDDDCQNWGLGLTAIDETSNEISGRISEHSNHVFTMNPGEEVPEDYEDFEKSDPLYCPPVICELNDESPFATNTTSMDGAVDGGFTQLDVSVSEIIARQSELEYLRRCELRAEKKKSKSLEKGKRSSPKRSRRSNPTRQSILSTKYYRQMRTEVMERQTVFLKPGKEYARSLSILNTIHNGNDFYRLSNGKGKNWRKSVMTVLAMQEEGLVQTCLGKNDDEKGMQRRYRALSCIAPPDSVPCLEEQSVGSASPSRFIKRMSIRVVPDDKRLSQVEDTSFLEAYGITASKSRKTLYKSPEIQVGVKTPKNIVQYADTEVEIIEKEQVATPRDVVLQRCGQEDYLPFRKCFPSSYLDNCRKIGEGVYGEVFLYENGEETSVIKIIPIEGEALVNGERQKKFDEILSEIVIAKELHNLRHGDEHRTNSFAEVKNLRCIKGKYPKKLIELWQAYDNDKGSDNDCPSMFDRNQLYIVLELGHGGEDLEAFVFDTADDADTVFIQVALALAVAEQSLEFEHRDLHWGNVLISETKNTEVTYILNNEEHKYPSKGLQVTIIDFTLSRMSYDGCCIFNDLALDPGLFTAKGEYQFEVYRLMREKVGNIWQSFEPFTNILWLHYIVDKIISSLRYKRKFARPHREAIYRLHAIRNFILNYKSAFDFVTNCETFKSLRFSAETVRSKQPAVITID